MNRDFSEENFQKLCAIAREVKDENFWGIFDGIGDFFLGLGEWIGLLQIDHYINNVSEYHRKVIDKNDTSEDKIREIFQAVENVDIQSGQSLKNISDAMTVIQSGIKALSEVITSGGNFSCNYMNEKFNASFGGYENYKTLVIDDVNELQSLELALCEDPTLLERLGNWADRIAQCGGSLPGNLILEGTMNGLTVIAQKGFKIPQFRNYIGKNGTPMVAVCNSANYQAGRNGVRVISEKNLLKRTDSIGKAYKVNNRLKTANNLLIGLNGLISFYDEYKAGEGLDQTQRISNASVEAAFTIGSSIAIGAAVGSIVPVVGTAIGAIIGFGASLLLDNVVHAKWFDNGQKSAMDYVKDGVYSMIKGDFVGNVSKGNAKAAWLYGAV